MHHLGFHTHKRPANTQFLSILQFPTFALDCISIIVVAAEWMHKHDVHDTGLQYNQESAQICIFE